MNACACIGPIGACPCVLGSKYPIKETFISPDVFDCLSEEDKKAINELKMKAFALYAFKNQNKE